MGKRKVNDGKGRGQQKSETKSRRKVNQRSAEGREKDGKGRGQQKCPLKGTAISVREMRGILAERKNDDGRTVNHGKEAIEMALQRIA